MSKQKENMFKHNDQIRFRSKVTSTQSSTEDAYHSSFISEDFSNPIELLSPEPVQQLVDEVTGYICRQIDESTYVVRVSCTYPGGYFSDKNFIVAHEATLELMDG
jgi:exonuclease V gamma subunit